MRWATLATVSPERATAAWKPSYVTMPLASGVVLAVAEGAAGATGEVAARLGDCVDAQLAMTSTAAVRVKVRKSLNLVLIMPSIPTSIQPRGRSVLDNLEQPKGATGASSTALCARQLLARRQTMLRELEIKPQKEEERIVCFIRQQLREAGFDHLVLGLSGGIDSSLVKTIESVVFRSDVRCDSKPIPFGLEPLRPLVRCYSKLYYLHLLCAHQSAQLDKKMVLRKCKIHPCGLDWDVIIRLERALQQHSIDFQESELFETFTNRRFDFLSQDENMRMRVVESLTTAWLIIESLSVVLIDNYNDPSFVRIFGEFPKSHANPLSLNV